MLPTLSVTPAEFLFPTLTPLLGTVSLLAFVSTLVVLLVIVTGVAAEARRERRREEERRHATRGPRPVLRPAA